MWRLPKQPTVTSCRKKIRLPNKSEFVFMTYNAPVQRRAAQRTVRCNRLLAGLHAIEELDDSGFQGVLGADHEEARVLDQLFENFRAVP